MASDSSVPDTATRLRYAASLGEMSAVESLLAFIASDRGSAAADAAARDALLVASNNYRWSLVSYLADFLADTEGGEDSIIDISGVVIDGGAPVTTSRAEPATVAPNGEIETITVFVCPCQSQERQAHDS